jgi:eukaryotic-like serine/threonine-protein kinase
MPKICLMCGASFPDATAFCPADGSALRAAVQGDDLIGELVADRYLITDMISQGGMGAVYVASDVRLPQQFAIKVLKQQQTPDQSLIQRFRQEAEAVCRINHDRVARVFDFGFMADDRAYIVMEYVAGKTLAKLIEERGALDPLDAAKIIMMAAEGIDAAHRLGIVHRDLKPENVMILDDPDGGKRVKVLDFGIAKLKSTEESQGYTQPGFVIGTPAWMSPEQLLGENLDVRSDVYSLGLVAFALLTGEHAFTGHSEQAEMMARITVPPRTLSEVRPDVAWPAELLRLFERTLSKQPADRPATAGQFGKAMSTAVQSHSKVLTPARASTAAAAPSPMLASSAGSMAASPPLAVGDARAATPAKGRTPLLLGIGAAVVVVAVAGVLWQKGRSAAPTAAGPSAPVVTPEVAVVGASIDTVSGVRPDSPTAGAQPAASPVSGTTGAAQAALPGPTAGGRGAAGLRDSASASPAPAAPAGVTNAELQRIMSAFDTDDSERKARETILMLDVLIGRLRGAFDQGWAHNYLGKAHLALGDSEKACAAFERASALASGLPSLKKDSDEFRAVAGCRPS